MHDTQHNGNGDPRRASRQRRKQERMFARRHHAATVRTIHIAAVNARLDSTEG